MKTTRRSVLGALAACAVPAFAQGQAPSLRPIVPFTPGTGIDLVARTLAPRLSQRLGRPVVVENRAGACGNSAPMRSCARPRMATRCWSA